MEREQPHAQVVAGLWGRLKSVHIWQQGVAEAVRGLTCGSLVLSCLCLADTRFISLPHDVCISLKSEYLVFLYFWANNFSFQMHMDEVLTYPTAEPFKAEARKHKPTSYLLAQMPLRPKA